VGRSSCLNRELISIYRRLARHERSEIGGANEELTHVLDASSG
jgi:hypothetical protein